VRVCCEFAGNAETINKRKATIPLTFNIQHPLNGFRGDFFGADSNSHPPQVNPLAENPMSSLYVSFVSVILCCRHL
jgi:hypothetical protein